jgi:hypothetical protein
VGAYLCDVALGDVWYDNPQYCLYLGTNIHQIVFGGLCLLANGISCPWLLTDFASLFQLKFQTRLNCLFLMVLQVVGDPIQ